MLVFSISEQALAQLYSQIISVDRVNGKIKLFKRVYILGITRKFHLNFDILREIKLSRRRALPQQLSQITVKQRLYTSARLSLRIIGIIFLYYSQMFHEIREYCK